MHHDFLLRVVALRLRTGRIRLTRMAAERGPILSGACGQVSWFQTFGFQRGVRHMRRISPTQAPYSMAALRRAAGDGHLERSAPKAVSIRHVQ